jgi:hypothetical protein
MLGKRPAKRYISKRSISGRFLRLRSVTVHWRSITHSDTDRKKVLQNATLRAVRSKQSVLYSAYQVHALPCRDLLTNHGPSKPP